MTETPLLQIRLGELPTWSTEGWALPLHQRLQAPLTRRQADFVLRDSADQVHCFSLTSVLDEGYDWVDLYLQINADYLVQSDCRLGQEIARPYGRQNIIFQPFTLPESPISLADTEGHGPIARGFFSGWSGARHSLMALCDHCRRSFRLRITHTGWGPELYLFCDTGLHTLLAKPSGIEGSEPAAWKAFESQLPPCAYCGTGFHRQNAFRCPYCNEPYFDLKRYPQAWKREYHAICLYETEFQSWP